MAEHETQFFSDGSSNTFHVYFKNPIQIEPEAFYTASAVLDGQELSYFGQEGMSEVAVGCVTFQFQCSSESTNGTGVQGGQIPELIFYGPQNTDEH
jgi:BTB/POZ domain-containing protein 3/6